MSRRAVFVVLLLTIPLASVPVAEAWRAEGMAEIRAAGAEAGQDVRSLAQRGREVVGTVSDSRRLGRTAAVFGWLLEACDAAAEGDVGQAAQRAAVASARIRAAPPTPSLGYSFAREAIGTLAEVNADALEQAAQQGEEAYRRVVSREIRALRTVPALAIMSAYDLKAAEGAEQHRKADAVVTVTDEDGRPLPNTEVEIRQVSHDFLFGCAIPNFDSVGRWPQEARDAFTERFARLFNYATTENACKWANAEPQRGQHNYAQIDRMIEWCHEHGVRLKGHTLVWGNRGGAGVPRWLEPLPKGDVQQILEQRVRGMVRRFKGHIDYWDVVNEPTHCHWYDQNVDPDYTLHSLQWAREENPEAFLIVNDFGNFRGNQAERFRDYLLDLKRRGAPLDGLGIQAHDPPTWYSPELIYEVLDTLAEVGVDMHITEFTFRSNGEQIKGGFVEGHWTEEKHGEFYDMFYRMCFGHPQVKAITMWAMWDGSSWQRNGGVVRRDFTPKPAYEALDRLINREWRTELTATTDAQGQVRFRGFRGEYEVRAREGGGQRTLKVHVGD